MKEDKIIELMMREADGVITPRQQHKLSRYLEANPSMAEIHRQVLGCRRLLDKVAPVEFPTELPESIMDRIRALPAHRTQSKPRPSPMAWLLHRGEGQVISLRLVATVAITAVALVLVVRFAAHPPTGEDQRMSATLSPNSGIRGDHFDFCTVQLDGVNGYMEATSDGETIILGISLSADQPVPLRMSAEPALVSPVGGEHGAPVGETSIEISHPGDGTRVETRLAAPQGSSRVTITIRLDSVLAQTAEYRLSITLPE